ncbi:MAG: HU family DNA-binding protein [Clostridia bacterium]|nr:HU family DNA-binding protein [Clostridia bacterium]
MTKANIVDAVATKTGVTKKAAEAAVNAALEAIVDALKAGDKVQVFGFGTFEVKERAARTGRNPRTGETLEIAASKNVAFSAAKALKDSIK